MKNIKSLFLVFLVLTAFNLNAQQISSGGITVPTGFKITASQPVDDRMTVADSLSLIGIPNKYAGLQSYSVADSTMFVYDGVKWNRSIKSGDVSIPTLQSVLNAGHVSMGTPLTIRSANDANSKGSIQLTSQGVRLGGEAGGITLSGETGGVNIFGGSTGVEINSLGNVVSIKKSSPTNGSIEIRGNGGNMIIFDKNSENKIDISASGGVNIDALSNSINITAPGHAKVNSKNIVTSVNGVEANGIGELTLDIPESNFSTLTTAGTSGESTLSDGNLNIPRYDLDMGLVRTVEEGKTGWAMRVHTSDPRYDNIGTEAIELMSVVTTPGKGATGDYSTIVGGYNHLASGLGSTVVGGNSNRATGQESIAIGGGSNWAVGQYSLSSGTGNRSFAFGEVTIGVNGTIETGGTATSPVATDRIFNIGNGTTTPNVKSNAFTIRRNGLATLPSVTNALITADATGKAIVTKEYLTANAVTPTQLTNGLSGKADDSDVVKLTDDQDIDGNKRFYGVLRAQGAVNNDEVVILSQLNDAVAEVTGSMIPLSGTEVEKPVTGNIKIGSSYSISGVDYGNGYGGIFYENGDVSLGRETDSSRTDIIIDSEYEIKVASSELTFKGIVGDSYYGANYDDNTYVQKKYVDYQFNSENLGNHIDNNLSIKATPSPDDEIVMLDSQTGEAVTATVGSIFDGSVRIAETQTITGDKTFTGRIAAKDTFNNMILSSSTSPTGLISGINNLVIGNSASALPPNINNGFFLFDMNENLLIQKNINNSLRVPSTTIEDIELGDAKGLITKEYFNSKVSYSTTETKTGSTWIDGKAIYRVVKLTVDPDPSNINIRFPDVIVGAYSILEYTKTTD